MQGRIKSYEYEEKHGRRRKHKEHFLSNPNIIDFELYILPFIYSKYGELEMKKVYSLYLSRGYDFFGR
jgi:hypothetical protein